MTKTDKKQNKDHRDIGRELDLFSFHEIAPGAPFWHGKGMIIWRELEKYLREKLDALGYQEVSTPVMVKKELFEKSGHWQHYRENMYTLNVDNEIYVLKPMNCPESTLIYSSQTRSYRDLPIRLSEITDRLHRKELSGVVGGLLRVVQMTQDDAHHYVRPDQIEHEVDELMKLIKEFYSHFNMPLSFNLATKPDNSMGDSNVWTKAEKDLESVLKKAEVKYQIKEKDGAFYGPKIDVNATDSQEREWTIATIQLDFQMPDKFKLEYVAEDGSKQRPVMIHRAIAGTFERFIGIITEHFQGAFPTWLSPIQVVVLPISDKHNEFAQNVFEQLKTADIRAELNDSNETLGKKIREAEMQKIPYLLVIGDKELQANAVAVRQRGKATERERLRGDGNRNTEHSNANVGSTEASRPNVGDIGQLKVAEFIEKIKKEIKSKI